MKYRSTTDRLLEKFLEYGYIIQGEYKTLPYYSVKRPYWCAIRDDAKEICVRLYTSDIRDHGKQKYILLSKPIDPKMRFRVIEKYYKVMGAASTDERVISYLCSIDVAIALRKTRMKLANVATCWIEEVFDYAAH